MNEADRKQEVISIQNLWAGYDKDHVLEDISLSVYEGDFLGLIGPNGGGKTTLIRVLLGILRPFRGQIRIMGKPVKKGRCDVGYVPQIIDFDREFPISVWDVARMGRLGRRSLLSRYSKEDDALVAEALHRVEMFDLRHRTIGELSGGQRQRVYIARALAKQPKILLLDEPTSSVDHQITTNIFELLKELNNHMTIFLISHDMSAISSHVKTVGCLNRRLFYHGTRKITPDMLEKTYQCPMDLITHGIPHRVLSNHSHTQPGRK